MTNASTDRVPAGGSLQALSDVPDLLRRAEADVREMMEAGAPLRDTLAYLTQTVEKQADGQVVAAILLLDAGGFLWTGAGPSLPHDYNAAIDGLKASADLGTCSVAAATGHCVLTPDIARDPNWVTIRHLPLGIGLLAAWSQPILDGKGPVLGTFGTYFRERRTPSERERGLVAGLAKVAATAIERKRAEDPKTL